MQDRHTVILLFNMWCLWTLGRVAERAYGHLAFGFIYLLTGLGGSLLSLAWDPTVVSAGASGAVFGVAGALVIFFWRDMHSLPTEAVEDTRNSLLFFVGYNLLYGFTNTGIDNAGHLGGLLMGLAMGLLLHRPLGAERPRLNVRHAVGVAAAVVFLAAGGSLTRVQAEDNPAVVAGVADRLWLNGERDRALGEYQRAIELDPSLDYVHARIGAVHLESGRNEDAIASFQRALELSPDDPLTYNDLGVAHQRLGQVDEAIAAYERALAHEPELAIALDNLGDVGVRSGRFRTAIDPFERLLEIEPDNIEALHGVGWAYMRNGDTELSEQALVRALELEPDRALARRHLGLLRLRTDRAAAGIADLRSAAELDGDHRRSELWIGEGLRDAGDIGGARETLEQALEQFPDDREILNQLSYTLAVDGEFSSGLATINRAIALEPEDGYLYDTRGTILFLQGDHAGAVESYVESLDLTNSAVHHYNLGLALRALGFESQAQERIDGALAAEPYLEIPPTAHRSSSRRRAGPGARRRWPPRRTRARAAAARTRPTRSSWLGSGTAPPPGTPGTR